MNYTFSLLILIVIGSIFGYLSGSFLFAIYISKIIGKKDITSEGSNNPGFTNSTRILGKKIGFLVLVLDVLKSVIPVIIFYLIYRFALFNYCEPYVTNNYNPMIFIYLPGIFATIGHIFPIYHKFKGGKGVACFGGLCICISPFIALLGIIILLIFIKLTKYVSLGSIITSLLVPFLILIPGINYIYLMYPNIKISVDIIVNNILIVMPIFGFMSFLVPLIIFRHKKNIQNLLKNKELKI